MLCCWDWFPQRVGSKTSVFTALGEARLVSSRRCGQSHLADSEIRTHDGALHDDFSEQNRSWDDSWDDHFGDLGYLPKFYGFQDARFNIYFSNGEDFTSTFTKNH